MVGSVLSLYTTDCLCVFNVAMCVAIYISLYLCSVHYSVIGCTNALFITVRLCVFLCAYTHVYVHPFVLLFYLFVWPVCVTSGCRAIWQVCPMYYNLLLANKPCNDPSFIAHCRLCIYALQARCTFSVSFLFCFRLG